MNMKKEIKISVKDFNEILNKSQADAIKSLEDMIDENKRDNFKSMMFSMQNMMAMVEFEKELKKNLKISEE